MLKEFDFNKNRRPMESIFFYDLFLLYFFLLMRTVSCQRFSRHICCTHCLADTRVWHTVLALHKTHQIPYTALKTSISSQTWKNVYHAHSMYEIPQFILECECFHVSIHSLQLTASWTNPYSSHKHLQMFVVQYQMMRQTTTYLHCTVKIKTFYLLSASTLNVQMICITSILEFAIWMIFTMLLIPGNFGNKPFLRCRFVSTDVFSTNNVCIF